MSQDVVADGLNQIMNANRIEKRELVIRRYSKVLLNLFEIMREKNHIEFEVDEEAKIVRVKILKLNECRAVKPRYYVGVAGIDKYLRRFVPSRNFGTLVISTNKGLLDHKEAVKENLGGSVVAYFY
ncbi:30S ribosomal protein S8 [Candidatus Pacearchaeota archaeon]|nr:30S ribosomal protein S8 [Candidatus Pacearchaeota archaeon]